ncbi:UNKNOWN [Stylonychia lemnae]|uniref:Transmembrane protein n=1 Tax=Stylonychia lemnae TaxID=5949 RepID=A0A078B3A3_STYLE|nr:UNKNOWN [Stylonychia lemnae]|eukprot:CDW88914.1 UNKNOWN [Stylonychia lemnae]
MPNQSQQPIVLPGDQYPSVNQHTEEERQANQNNSQQQQRNQFQPGFNQQFQQMPPMMPPPQLHPAYYQHGMMPPPPQPQFLDQRCINLVKAKKSVKRLGTCQIVSHFIFVLINGIIILNDLILLFTIGELSKMIIHDKSGKSHTVQIEESGLVIMTLFKIAMHALLLKWGLVGFKTFKPIVKDLKKQELAGMLSTQSHDSVEPVVKRSKQIKKFKKISTKVFIGTLVLIFLSSLYTRFFFQSTADTFLDAYYGENNQTQDGINSKQKDQLFKNSFKLKDTHDGFNYDSSSQGFSNPAFLDFPPPPPRSFFDNFTSNDSQNFTDFINGFPSDFNNLTFFERAPHHQGFMRFNQSTFNDSMLQPGFFGQLMNQSFDFLNQTIQQLNSTFSGFGQNFSHPPPQHRQFKNQSQRNEGNQTYFRRPFGGIDYRPENDQREFRNNQSFSHGQKREETRDQRGEDRNRRWGGSNFDQEEEEDWENIRGSSKDSNRKHRPHHKKGEFDVDFNFDEMSKDEAKQAVTQIINWVALASFIWSVVVLACVGGCCLLAINKAKRSQKLREAYLQQQQPSNSGIQVGLAQPNSNGFQKVPTDESDLSSNNNVIPRGVVVNSLH